MKVEFEEYSEEVMKQLEHIEYPYWIQEFRPEDIARTLHKSIKEFYFEDISPRMAAICIFGLTMTYQVLAHRPDEIVH